MKTLKIRKKVVPDLIFFTAHGSENISFIFSLVSLIILYFITLYIINTHTYPVNTQRRNDVVSTSPRCYKKWIRRYYDFVCDNVSTASFRCDLTSQ